MQKLPDRFAQLQRDLSQHFIDKEETIRLLLVATVAGEHLLLVGPPGTAKSALIRRFSQLIAADYFEYLLTRFSEPNEIFGPVDIDALRKGRYVRRTEGMLPRAQIAFLDEIFKANSPILNALLSILNERRFLSGHEQLTVPLMSLFAAANEVPADDSLAAIFDRFLLRVESKQLESHQFLALMSQGLKLEREGAIVPTPILSAADIKAAQATLLTDVAFPDDFMARYKGIVFQIRAEGISFSDRRAVRTLKLIAASAKIDGRAQAHDGDLALMRHVWNTPEQREIVAEIVAPVLDRFAEEHPDARRTDVRAVDIDGLIKEVAFIRDSLRTGDVSDVRLFAHLRSLTDIKSALQALGSATSQSLTAQVEELLEQVLAASKVG